MVENRDKNFQNFIRWCIEYDKMNSNLKQNILKDTYEEIKKYGFDNLSSHVYVRLISFYTCKLLKDKNSAKYISSILKNSNVDISSIDNLYRDVDGARKLARSLLLFNKGYNKVDGEYLDYLQKFMGLGD